MSKNEMNLVAIEVENCVCYKDKDVCHFFYNCSPCPEIKCSPKTRSDGKNVIWVEANTK